MRSACIPIAASFGRNYSVDVRMSRLHPQKSHAKAAPLVFLLRSFYRYPTDTGLLAWPLRIRGSGALSGNGDIAPRWGARCPLVIRKTAETKGSFRVAGDLRRAPCGQRLHG